MGRWGHPEPAPRQGGIEADAPMFVPEGLSCSCARVTEHLSTCQGLSVLGTCPSAPNGAICRGVGVCGVIVGGLWLQHTALSRAGCTLSPLPAGTLVAHPLLLQPNAGADTRFVRTDLAQRQLFSSPPLPAQGFSPLARKPQGQPPALASTLPSSGFGSCCASPLGVARGSEAGCGWGRVPGTGRRCPHRVAVLCFLLQAVFLAPLPHPHNPGFTPSCYSSEHPCVPHPTSPIWDPHPPDPNHVLSPCLVPDPGTPTSPLARTHAGGPVAGTDPLSVQLLPNLPGEECRLLPLQLRDPCHHLGGGRAGLAAPDGFGFHGPRPVEAAQDLADAAVGHLRHGEAGGCSVGRFLGGRTGTPTPGPGAP